MAASYSIRRRSALAGAADARMSMAARAPITTYGCSRVIWSASRRGWRKAPAPSQRVDRDCTGEMTHFAHPASSLGDGGSARKHA